MLRVLVVLVLLVRVVHAEPSVQDLISKLADPSAETRQRAAQQLGYRTKEPARFDALEKAATTDPDPTVRLRALEGLSPQYLDIGKAPRWKALRLKLMKDADPKVRYEAVSQLRPAESDTVAAHLALLKSDKDASVRRLVILSLHDSHAPGLVEAIIPMIEDKDLQGTVISTLGFSKDPRAVAPLLEAVKRQQPGAASALANTRDPKAVEALLALIDKTTNVDLRHEVITAIPDVPDGRFVPPLLAIWSKLGKADKRLSTKEQEDPMEDMRDLPHSITAALQAIAELDPAPCQAAKTATGETKAYLQKVVPKKCGGGALDAGIEKLVEGQLVQGAKLDAIYAADAAFSLAGATDEPQVARDRIAAVLAGATRVGPPRIGRSADDKSAWVAMVVKVKDVEWRVSELAINTPNGWRIAGGLASVGQDNKAVNTAAKANKLKLAALPDGKSDAALAKTFGALTKTPLDAAAASREELVAFGSGPGERTTSGGILARAWKAAWAKRITVDGPVIARLAPSGLTGFVIANIFLEKPDKPAYKVPFRVLFLFDKAGASWSLVHAHFATAAP